MIPSPLLSEEAAWPNVHVEGEATSFESAFGMSGVNGLWLFAIDENAFVATWENGLWLFAIDENAFDAARGKELWLVIEAVGPL